MEVVGEVVSLVGPSSGRSNSSSIPKITDNNNNSLRLWAMNCIAQILRQRFSTVTVMRPLDDLSTVSATPNNKIVWVTLKESIFRG